MKSRGYGGTPLGAARPKSLIIKGFSPHFYLKKMKKVSFIINDLEHAKNADFFFVFNDLRRPRFDKPGALLYNPPMMKNKLAEIGGWVGMVLIHGATIPTSLSVIMGWSSVLPPLDMVLMIWAGLALFFLRAIARVDWLYLVSNAIGFILNSILLAIIVFGG